MSQAVITADKLSKTFSTGGNQHHVLKNLDLEIRAGEFTVIMGASGAGKSTLLYALSGIDRPTLGSVTFDGQCISDYTEDKLAVFRRKHCGFVFQQIYLLDNMSLLDNCMAAGLLIQKNRKQVADRAESLLAQLALTQREYQKFPAQVSGGEAQRAGLARALINNPSVLFADEPTGALNSAAGTAVLDALTHFHSGGQTVVMVTHDMKSALRGNRVIYLKDGVVCGECHLGAYTGSDTARHEQLHSFLIEMGW